MSPPRLDLVVLGDVAVTVRPTGVERAEALGISRGRIAAVGRRDEVLAGRGPGTRVLDVGSAAVIPGLHDFHLHLVGLARGRADVALDDAPDAADIGHRLRSHLAALAPDAWLTGRGWSERHVAAGLEHLREAVGERPTFLASHDGHSAWVSPAAMRMAGIGPGTGDPPGGRIERDAAGEPTGVLRETALDLVSRLVRRLRGEELRPAMEATLADLASRGITGATDAGDYTDEGGSGPDAALGDSHSTLTGLADHIDGRIRLTLGFPVDAIDAAASRGARTGAPLAGRRTMRFGWAKEYADGALGSGTAALFEPATCGDGGRGILRVDGADMDGLLAASRRSGIALAVHTIGDRAAASVLDAIERAGPRDRGVPADRMEHLQLLRADDRERIGRLGVTASVQPVHAAADRDLAEACWAGRVGDAYAYRSLVEAGAVLAAGSDAPIESVDPWLGMFAAVHRRMPSDSRGDWTPAQALRFTEALAAYTSGPAAALGAPDEGHLGVGARADLVVLDRSLDELSSTEELPSVRVAVTMVDGSVVHEG